MKRCYICDCTFKQGTILGNLAICNQCEFEMNFEVDDSFYDDDLEIPLDDDILVGEYFEDIG